METAANLHAVPHWERINAIKSRVDIAFDLGVDPAKTNAAQLRRALFATLNNDVLPQIVEAAPAGVDLHAIGSTDSDFDVASVDFSVAKGGTGQWHKEGNGKDAVLSGKVAVTLQTDYPIAAADALATVRTSVADEIAELLANSFGNFMNSKISRNGRKPKAMANRIAA